MDKCRPTFAPPCLSCYLRTEYLSFWSCTPALKTMLNKYLLDDRVSNNILVKVTNAWKSEAEGGNSIWWKSASSHKWRKQKIEGNRVVLNNKQTKCFRRTVKMVISTGKCNNFPILKIWQIHQKYVWLNFILKKACDDRTHIKWHLGRSIKIFFFKYVTSLLQFIDTCIAWKNSLTSQSSQNFLFF